MGLNMRFLSYNFIAGSSELSFSSGSDYVNNLLDRNSSTKWTSVSEGTDGTTSTITWTPATTYVIDRLYLQNHNLENYVFYVGGTGGTAAVTIIGNTGTNSYHEIGTYSIGTTTTCVLSMTHTISANSEKSVGEIWIGTQQFEVDNNPMTYEPISRKKGYDLEMADGGVKSIWLGQKFYAEMSWQFVDTTELANFKSLYDAHREFVFVPTPVETGTGWDGDAWECNWIGNYDALKISNDIGKTTGYDINMSIWETSG